MCNAGRGHYSPIGATPGMTQTEVLPPQAEVGTGIGLNPPVGEMQIKVPPTTGAPDKDGDRGPYHNSCSETKEI